LAFNINRQLKEYLMQKILLIFVIFITFSMVIFPQEAYSAASQGLLLWWQVVLPSLLPFFICAELLVAMGAMNYMGALLEPLMRPIFRLPGEASLAIVMGYTSGFPTGAAITARLRQNNLISKEEGERLLAFTNNASPLFIVVGVATGILNSPELGMLLLGIHYLSNLCIGIFLRFFAKENSSKTQKRCFNSKCRINIIRHNEPIGKLIKNAAQKAGGNIAIIGCYLVFFSVLTQMLATTGLAQLLWQPFLAWGFPNEIIASISAGFWEMTLGVNTVGSGALTNSVAFPLCAGILAWGGLSVQAQVAAMVSETDIRCGIYLVCRFIHAAISFILALAIYHSPWMPTIAAVAQIPARIYPIPFYINLYLPFLCVFLVLALTLIGRMVRH